MEHLAILRAIDAEHSSPPPSHAAAGDGHLVVTTGCENRLRPRPRATAPSLCDPRETISILNI
jgi:hypothetical protein